MHMLAVEKILDGCRERSAAGADVTKANAAHGPETYEDCIIELGRQRDTARQETLTTLADAIRAFAPDLAEDLRKRWNCASGKDLLDLLRAMPVKTETTK